MNNRMAQADLTISEREKKHKAISTHIAAEGIVLLENKGVLPFEGDVKTIALFGNGARRTHKGGTGSGDVNTRGYVTVEQGLKNAGYTIVTDALLSEHEATMVAAKKEYDDHVRALSHEGVGVALLTMMGKPFVEPTFRTLSERDLAPADAAVYVLGRISGEGADRTLCQGDYLLTRNEERDIAMLAKAYERFVLLLNVGGVVDIEGIRTLPGAVVLMGQGGSGCGDSIARVITGEVNPSGRLTATWAKRYEDYPCADAFAVNPDDVWYREGIFVGYRWFDAFCITPRYPFGYGLSYTAFQVNTDAVTVKGDKVTVNGAVTNTGKHPGKEVVQVYGAQPTGRLAKAPKMLIGFEKTKLLAPGESQRFAITFPAERLAAYDDAANVWVLEKGAYGILVGTHAGNAMPVATLILDSDVITQRCKGLFRDEKIEEVIGPAHAWIHDGPTVRLDPGCILTVCHRYTDAPPALTASNGEVTFQDVCRGKATAEALVSRMTAKETALLCIGAARVSLSDFSVIGNASRSIPGAAGDTTGLLAHYGIPQCAMADGPAGIRVNPKVYERSDGYINNPAEDPIFSMILSPELQKVDLSGATVKYQYCTALPVAVQLAQTWDIDLLEQAGDIIGTEMDALGIDLWLAPGMNIQRNPLCGRNFEYFSEDPLLSGLFASAITKGVQRHPGKGTCIKHLAANNQETNRSTSNSHVSQRALREIYLKGFEICVKEAQPLSAMTAMNLINGVHTANDVDLLTHALRDEWGFDGAIMTDWGTTGGLVSQGEQRAYGPSTAVGCITAGNDLIMPGTKHDEDELFAAAENGTLSLGALQACSVRIIKLLKKCAPGMKG